MSGPLILYMEWDSKIQMQQSGGLLLAAIHTRTLEFLLRH